MHHTPLVQVIQSFGKRERNELQRWVESPFVNRRPEVVRLCEHLCQELPYRESPETPSGELSKPAIYRRLFQEKSAVGIRKKTGSKPEKLSPAEDATLRYTMSFLFTAIKQWMAYREWSQNDRATGLMLCKSLRKRELKTVFEKEMKALQSEISQVQANTDSSLFRYQLEFEQFQFKIESNRQDGEQLQKTSYPFGIFVALIALKHGCAALNTPGLSFESMDFLPETLARVESGQYHEIPLIQIYYRCFRLMQNLDEGDYRQLKSLLLVHSTAFPRDEIRDGWLVALNYCIRRINTGNRSWNLEAFEMYKNALNGTWLLENDLMPGYMYQNIMLLAVACNEWEWGRQFLDDYRGKLPIGERNNAYIFNLAQWHFKRKDYSNAQEILSKVEFRNVYYNLDARKMMVRMYYEQGEFMALDSLLHSFKTYLQRHRNISYHHHHYTNFVRTIQQILRLKPGDANAREQLRQKIKAEKYLTEREWLEELLQ